MGCSYARAAEQKFIAEGFGVQRFPAMYNDIILHRTGARSSRHQGNCPVSGSRHRPRQGQGSRGIARSGRGGALNMRHWRLHDLRRGSWVSFRNGGDLVVGVEGDRMIFNQMGRAPSSHPAQHPNAQDGAGQQFNLNQ
jgi:tungstate transport system substrate-binding protein